MGRFITPLKAKINSVSAWVCFEIRGNHHSKRYKKTPDRQKKAKTKLSCWKKIKTWMVEDKWSSCSGIKQHFLKTYFCLIAIFFQIVLKLYLFFFVGFFFIVVFLQLVFAVVQSLLFGNRMRNLWYLGKY